MNRPLIDENNPYFLPKEEYLTALHYALQYKEWCKELSAAPDTSKTIAYDGEKVQTSGGYDSTAEVAIRRQMIAKKKRLVEDTIREAGGEIYPYLLRGVCGGQPFWELRQQGMPCEKDYYYKRRQKFYYLLSRKI